MAAARQHGTVRCVCGFRHTASADHCVLVCWLLTCRHHHNAPSNHFTHNVPVGAGLGPLSIQQHRRQPPRLISLKLHICLRRPHHSQGACASPCQHTAWIERDRGRCWWREGRRGWAVAPVASRPIEGVGGTGDAGVAVAACVGCSGAHISSSNSRRSVSTELLIAGTTPTII
jgi:hypothetical protein